MNTNELVASILGGGGFATAVLYVIYQACAGKCASHLQVAGKSLSIDLKDVEEVIEQLDTPKEREEVKREIEEHMKNTLYRVKSRL